MLSAIYRLRWLNRLSLRTLVEGNACGKNFSTKAPGFFNENSIGYAKIVVLRYSNNCTLHHSSTRLFNSKNNLPKTTERELDPVRFDQISNETLESLTEYFDELVEKADHLQEADVSYGDGVLTVKFGENYGTYVINRQTPNKQIWLSSPKSGPKRYDFISGKWIYKHDGKSLHDLLDDEIPSVVNGVTAFRTCSYGGTEK